MTPRPYDVQVAGQVAILQALGLRIHIPKKGSPFFTRKHKVS